MILGFLGKGGSGKSTVATQMALWLHEQGKEVLAIDADHNMDLVFNLTEGALPEMKYLGSSRADLFAHVKASPETNTYRGAFLGAQSDSFYLTQADLFTQKYSLELKDRLHIMAAGPQTDAVLGGGSCSHSLSAPLKVYLPLLKLDTNQAVVVDEKAGADGVSTGTATGLDLAIIVVEPSLHSTKTAVQIIDLLKRFNVPLVVLANKITTPDDLVFIQKEIKQEITGELPHLPGIGRTSGVLAVELDDAMAKIYKIAAATLPTQRHQRTIHKFQNQT